MNKKQPPTMQEYEDHVKQIIYSKAPYIYPCAKCGWAVESGFCCSICGTGDSREPEETQGSNELSSPAAEGSPSGAHPDTLRRVDCYLPAIPWH